MDFSAIYCTGSKRSENPPSYLTMKCYRITWQIYQATVNITNGFEALTSLNLSTIAPQTYTTSQARFPIRSFPYFLKPLSNLIIAQLVLPALSLAPAIYKLLVTVRMWDTSPTGRKVNSHNCLCPSEPVSCKSKQNVGYIIRGRKVVMGYMP